jgi:putative thioredoxin
MPHSQFVIDVNETDFQTQVIERSTQQPVVVDFWAEWCIPCRSLDPILEKLAENSAGAFLLAKLDVDRNPRLAMQFGVKGIPAVKAFRNGQVVAEFTGLQSETRIREFVGGLGPSTFDLTTGKANGLLAQGEWSDAEDLLRQVIEENPDHPGALLGIARARLALGETAGALPILRNFPASKEYIQAEQLTVLAQAMADAEIEPRDEDELAPTYANALRLVGRGQLAAAMDGLLGVLRENKNYRKGEARKAAIGLLALLGEDSPLTRQYRNELASLLF